jgi:hypothetical protein
MGTAAASTAAAILSQFGLSPAQFWGERCEVLLGFAKFYSSLRSFNCFDFDHDF